MDEHEDKGESPVKTERIKSNDSMEMLKFFDLLPEGAREEILKNFCRNATEFTKDEDKEETCRSGDHFLQELVLLL